MIKKTTQANFTNGSYAGVYDWSGGIPLTVGETIKIVRAGHDELIYRLIGKSTVLEDDDETQHVTTKYFFDIIES